MKHQGQSHGVRRLGLYVSSVRGISFCVCSWPLAACRLPWTAPAYIYREDNSLQVLYLHLNSINHPHSSALLQNLVIETSCGHNLKCLLGEKALVVGQAAQGQNRRLRGAILLHDASHRAPGRT